MMSTKTKHELETEDHHDRRAEELTRAWFQGATISDGTNDAMERMIENAKIGKFLLRIMELSDGHVHLRKTVDPVTGRDNYVLQTVKGGKQQNIEWTVHPIHGVSPGFEAMARSLRG